MKESVIKYAIAIGDEWFTGFMSAARPTVGRSSCTARLLEEDSVKLALADLLKCGFVGEVYQLNGTRIDRREFE